MKRICKDAQHLYDFSKPVKAYRFSYVPFKGVKHIEPPAPTKCSDCRQPIMSTIYYHEDKPFCGICMCGREATDPADPRNCPFIEKPHPVACAPRCCNCVA